MESMSAQLSRVRPTLLKGQPRTIPIFKILAEIPDILEGERLNIARTEVLKWAKKRAGRLPDKAWEAASFEMDAPGNPASAVRLQTVDADYWVLRLNDMDKQIAGQVWTTEITVAQVNARGLLGIRQALMTKQDEVDYTPGVPGVVLQLSDSLSLMQDGISLGINPWVLSSDSEVDRLVKLIDLPTRKLPVIAFALPGNAKRYRDTILDADALAKKLLGIGHVIVIPASQAYRLSDLVGKSLSVYSGAVRTYRPGCDTSTDNPFRHPLALPNAIENWADSGPNAFVNLLVKSAAQETLRWSDDDIPPFVSVRQALLEQRRKIARSEHKSDAELLALADEEIVSVKAERDDFALLAQDEERERITAEARASEAESNVYWLKQRIELLENQLRDASGGRSPEVPIPDSLIDLQEWTQQYMAGRLILTPKAVRAAKNSEFSDNNLIYKAMLMMGQEYYEMKNAGGQEKQEKFNNKLKELGLENTRTGDEKRLQEEGDEFIVLYKGHRELLVWHLKNGGNTRDPARCFRLYYFWSDEDSQVIVGSLPGHLHTRAS